MLVRKRSLPVGGKEIRGIPSVFHIAVNVSGNQVMHIGASLGLFQDAPAGRKDIIVHQERAVVYFQEQVLHVIIIEQVARYAGSCVIQSSQRARPALWIRLWIIRVSTAAWNLIPPISAPVN